jgi:hypothetical protein
VPINETTHLKVANRVDRLWLTGIDVQRLLLDAVYNKLMNSYVLRIAFGSNCKATLQIFLSHNSAMCFTSNCSPVMLMYLFNVLARKYGIIVKTCRLCTTVWSYCLLSKIGDLGKFYMHVLTFYPELKIDFNPEVFPCLTIHFGESHLRVFHTGKVVLLGIKCTAQLTSAVDLMSDLFFGYSLSKDFGNF